MDRFAAGYLDEIAQRLYSSVLSDVLDDAGHRQQVMRPQVRPLYAGAKVVGRAATMLAIEVSQPPPEPYKLLMELLDALRPGEVVVGAVQGESRAALWGELLSTHTRAKGGRGVVIDGLSRDSWGIVEMKFPVFATGLSPADSKGRLDVVAIRSTIPVGGVAVADGDLVVADDDGCVVVPVGVEEEVVRLALEKVSGEDTMRDILRKGASLRDVFAEYGIL
ncbi:MAG TPA: RraA family protein [Candidatus Dormibacteraeota bacterium]|nr:RraA family protein [Candidatus Dormibacteraeota bacterium]